jgi:predicted RNA-binding protein (virulence factor B family)
MHKVRIIKEVEESIAMKNMKPGQIGMVVDDGCDQKGDIVFRNLNSEVVGIISLSECEEDSYWGSNATVKVKLLKPGTKIEITVGEGNVIKSEES